MTFTIQTPLRSADGPNKTAYDADEDARIDLYGPIPINPFTTLRADRGMNINQLAIPTRVNNKALTRLERGMYVNPLPRVVEYWVNRGVVTEGALLADYEDFRYLTRRRNEFFLGPSLHFRHDDPLHPLRQLRLCRPSLVDQIHLPVGLFDFCAALCVPLDSVQGFEKKWQTVQSVPKELKLALNQCGYTSAQISAFEASYKSWRSQHNSKVSIS